MVQQPTTKKAWRLAGSRESCRLWGLNNPKNYQNKHIAIVAHQAPQLALDVILSGKTWEQAIDEDWRKQKAWQPGWGYIIE
ncbi:MAG: hypothetical protein US42_C0005G0021 [Candidatus Magasanikbacteria bacterium GW2011_GWC2_37_14]|uniref:Uncharacterized protein n=1 Tax=Candidatus Magasanikbacteria bacterium GW2011_GWC2_37_14 TaxID=1619046 RepID=A0A0G0JID1_9BACT|nr:MAG: hypothetical protein US42_C0005G0021 [Candidatus Magasanikbacteria bacterium GW2011_GWC2_37_14]